jgi:hypothetical protein
MSDGNESDDEEKLSSEKKAKSPTKVRTLHEGRQLTVSAGIYCKQGSRYWQDAQVSLHYA